jgi:hypothetical protein
VDEIMGSTKKGRRVLYLVKWLDYPDRRDWTNELFDNFSEGGLEKLREFHRRNPEAPRDYRLAKDRGKERKKGKEGRKEGQGLEGLRGEA